MTCESCTTCPLNGVCHNHGILTQELLHLTAYSFMSEFAAFNFQAWSSILHSQSVFSVKIQFKVPNRKFSKTDENVWLASNPVSADAGSS